MLKRKGIFGLLLGLLLSVGVVYAASALTADEFVEKMKDLDYTVVAYGDSAYAYDGDSMLEMYQFKKYDSAEDAKEDIEEAYEETEKYDKLKHSKTSAGNKTCITLSGEKDGEYSYLTACAIEDTIVLARTNDKDSVSNIKNTMKELGYSSGGSVVLYIIIAVVIVGALGAALYYFTKKKGNNGGNNMPYGQPMNNYGQPMGQNMGFNQPMGAQPMNQGMNNFGQPVGPQPMYQGMNNFNQPVGPQPMDQGMNNFNQPVGPQPIDQGMNSFGQPMNSQPTDPNFNNNQMNNNFSNMN